MTLPTFRNLQGQMLTIGPYNAKSSAKAAQEQLRLFLLTNPRSYATVRISQGR